MQKLYILEASQSFRTRLEPFVLARMCSMRDVLNGFFRELDIARRDEFRKKKLEKEGAVDGDSRSESVFQLEDHFNEVGPESFSQNPPLTPSSLGSLIPLASWEINLR
jgi:hypothetical protein